MKFEAEVDQFVQFASQHGVRMLMVGGGAVNYHGYKRHSADVDFWIDVTPANLEKLKQVLTDMGYDLEDFPQPVKDQEQNVSMKISPSQEIELITRFNPGKSFEEAFADSIETELGGKVVAKYRVLSYEDLLESKTRSDRPKDQLDIQELKRIRKES